MTRWIAATSAALMLAFGLALAVPYGNYASADGVSAPVYHRTALRKRCIAPADWWGRGQSSWICEPLGSNHCCAPNAILHIDDAPAALQPISVPPAKARTAAVVDV